MKKILIIILYFLSMFFSVVYADEIYDYNPIDNICNYYNILSEHADFLIEHNSFDEAEGILKEIYESKCKTEKDIKSYIKVLYKLNKLNEAYEIAQENNLLDSQEGLIVRADMNLVDQDTTISRSVYDNILIKSPYDKFSEMTLTHNYIYIGSPQQALEELNQLPKNENVQLLKAQAFYNMEMYEQAYEILETLNKTPEIIKFKNRINRQRGYKLSTGYELYYQKLNEEFKLDSNKIAFTNACFHKNLQVYLDYIMHIYTSGRLEGYNNSILNNFTNELRLGTIGRLREDIALRSDIGVKIFQNKGAMILTNSWIKYFLNDDINFSLGFSRNNAEQTYLSAVGLIIDNKFTGQIANNHLYADSTIRFKNNSYLFLQGGFGIKEGYNIASNLYWDSTAGFGKVLRYNLSKPILQKISIDAISYNSGYQKNLENIYDSQGNLYGGYFSPIWYSDNTINLYLSGGLKEKLFSYGLGTFGGWQFAVKQHQSFFIWGTSVYGKLRMNEHISAELQYRYYKYANVTRNQLIFDFVITLFKKEKQKSDDKNITASLLKS